jgi:ABC-type branched-subunit amino acid transport system substrate-binding protein
MRSFRLVVACAALAFVLLTSTTAGAGGGSGSGGGGGEQLTATDVGVTADEIRIAVVADVENPLVPGFFAGAVAGVEGAADYINDNGGIAGRKVVVDFIDSHLSADDARNAVIQACAEDFALVGTSALFLNNVDDMVGCADKTGAPTGIPDIPLVVTEVVQQCSPVSFPINPPNLICDTKDEHPQSYRVNTSEIPYFQKEYGDLKGYFLIPNDLKAATDSTLVAVAGIEAAGVENLGETRMSLQSPRTAYTPAVQAIKDSGANYVFGRLPFPPLRQEAKVQGATGVEVWDCELPCYAESVIEEGGQDVDGQYVRLQFLPFDETKSNKMLKNFIKYTDPEHTDGYAPQAWAALLAFRQAAEAVVAEDGDDALTRAAVLGALEEVNDFDADGMIAPVDMGDRRIIGCGIVMQIQDGEFVRVHPKKAGTFACSKKNVQVVELDLQR